MIITFILQQISCNEALYHWYTLPNMACHPNDDGYFVWVLVASVTIFPNEVLLDGFDEEVEAKDDIATW